MTAERRRATLCNSASGESMVKGRSWCANIPAEDFNANTAQCQQKSTSAHCQLSTPLSSGLIASRKISDVNTGRLDLKLRAFTFRGDSGTLLRLVSSDCLYWL